jgi:hypothetical protein
VVRKRTGATATIRDVTAKEMLLQRAPKWTEREAEIALRAVTHESGGADEWGDVDAQMDVAMSESLRDLDEEERKAGFEPWRP